MQVSNFLHTARTAPLLGQGGAGGGCLKIPSLNPDHLGDIAYMIELPEKQVSDQLNATAPHEVRQ